MWRRGRALVQHPQGPGFDPQHGKKQCVGPSHCSHKDDIRPEELLPFSGTPVPRNLCLVSFSIKDLIIIRPLHHHIQPGHSYPPPSRWMEGCSNEKSYPQISNLEQLKKLWSTPLIGSPPGLPINMWNPALNDWCLQDLLWQYDQQPQKQV